MAETKRRIADFKKALYELMVTDDAFDLNPTEPGLKLHAKKEYRFRTSSQKMDAFNDWLTRMIDGKVLGIGKGENAWTAKYIDSAYKKGLVRSYTTVRKIDLSKPLGFYEGRRTEFLRSSFGGPESADKVRFLATRTFNGMKGFTEAMKQELNRILADGMVNGKGARAVASDMVKRIDGLTRKRALVIARTEAIAAHAQGQLDAFKALGVEEVGADVEWSTAGDDSVCPLCHEMEGKVFTIEEAQGKIPLHPNCRCAWIPHVKKVAKRVRR
jgi:SPP1 gp7 family putative phage head morphogenesis protein